MTSLEQRLEDIEYKIEVLEREDFLYAMEQRVDELEERLNELEEEISEKAGDTFDNTTKNRMNKIFTEVMIPELLKIKNELDGKASTEEMLRLLLISR